DPRTGDGDGTPRPAGDSQRRMLGDGKPSTNPCWQLSAGGALASYRVAPTSAVGLGLPTARSRCAGGWARSALALPKPAVFDPVATGGHVAPGACPAMGAVVEGPLAVWVAAGFESAPGAVALCVADDKQEG